MRDRHGGTPGTRRSINLSIELLRKRLDDAGSQAGFALSEGGEGITGPIDVMAGNAVLIGQREAHARVRPVARFGDASFATVRGGV